MHISRFVKNSVVLLALSAVAMVGCKKSSHNFPNNEDDNGGYASDISRIEWASEDVLSLVDVAGTYYNGRFMKMAPKTSAIGECAIVGTDTLSSPRTLTIRFGSTNCECLDGRMRRGSIIVSYDGNFQDTNRVKTITFNEYYVNDRKLSGTINITRVDTTVVGNWFYKIKTDVTMTTSPDAVVKWQGNLVRKWRSGFGTGDRSDDVYSISGSAKLTRSNGHVFACDIATPLHVAMSCDYIRFGLININAFEGLRYLNYSLGGGESEGACDANAQVTVNGNIYQVNL
jgi:hypothetical protein